MASKEEISAEINDRLDTDLDWSRMTKEDLEEFLLMMETDQFIQKVLKYKAKEMGTGKLEEQIDEWYPFKLVKGVL